MSKETLSYTSKICKHISRIMGNDKRRSQIIAEVQGWFANSGPQWTVERLRSLKQGLIDYIGSQELQISKKFILAQEKNWIKVDAQGWPKGPLGKYIKSTLTSSDGKTLDKKISRVKSILEVSRVIRSETILPSQRKKYIEAISGLPGRADLFDYSYGRGKRAFNLIKDENFQKVFTKNYPKEHKFSFAALNTAKALTSFIPSTLRKTTENQWLLSLIETTLLDSPFNPILEDMGVPVNKNQTATLQYAGVIKVLQEGSLKARVVAMPSAGAQIAFKPLHKTLCHVLKDIPQDCTFNQTKGIEWGAEQLRKGKTMYAVDLSSATDNFPLGFQIAVLEELGYKYSDNFKQLCQLPWGYKDNAFTRPVQYTKGQPMGLYGSFTLFSLSHHIVVKAIERKLNKIDTYRILGDDIIINDDAVYKAYLSVMADLHVPISHHKCLISDFYTEFAGKLISPNGKIPVAKGPKGLMAYGQIDPNQFLNYAEVTGKVDDIISAIPKQYHNYARKLAALPEYFGGLGINPDQKPWLDRVAEFDSVLRTKGFPKFKDLRTSMIELKFIATGNHVGDVLNFVSEQLIKVEREIDEKLMAKAAYAGLSHISPLKRVLLQQALEADGLDSSLSYVGSLTGSVAQKERNPKEEWRRRSQAISKSVNSRFDTLCKEYPDLTKVKNVELSKQHTPYSPWML